MDDVDTTERIDTVVIGGGQAGLAAGYHLQRRGLSFVILDAEARVGDHWRAHWDLLRLYTPAKADALPGLRFPASSYHYPNGREMGDYLETYARHFRLPVRSGVRVDGVHRVGGPDGGYLVTAGDQRFEAAQVIVATGAYNRPHVPGFAAELDPAIRQLHSSRYRNPAQLQDGPVLVVGLSHSGADIAYETARTHRTILAGRSHGQLPFHVIDTWRARVVSPLYLFLIRSVLTLRTPIGRKMAVEVRSPGGPLLRVLTSDLDRVGVERHAARVTSVRDGQPVLDDGQVLEVANIVWCTGFRPDYGWIRVPDFVGADGWPSGDRGVARTSPGLYYLGIPFTYAFTSMLVDGAGRDAAYVVDRIAERRAPSMADAMRPATASR